MSGMERAARLLGCLCQGVALGLLTSFALVQLYEVANHLTVFRYQGF